MSSLQFHLPRVVAEALPIETVSLRARASNIPELESARLEYSTRDVPYGQVRVTCSLRIALYLVEELRMLAGQAEERHNSELLIACAQGVTEIFKAIDRGEHQRGPASGIRPMPN